jgi:hypothetical protein
MLGHSSSHVRRPILGASVTSHVTKTARFFEKYGLEYVGDKTGNHEYIEARGAAQLGLSLISLEVRP